jgi:hypothetical protein
MSLKHHYLRYPGATRQVTYTVRASPIQKRLSHSIDILISLSHVFFTPELCFVVLSKYIFFKTSKLALFRNSLFTYLDLGTYIFNQQNLKGKLGLPKMYPVSERYEEINPSGMDKTARHQQPSSNS